MAYTFTRDEKSTGFFSNSRSSYSDVPSYFNNLFYLAPGNSNKAYGFLDVNNFSADSDCYSLGLLSAGTYTMTATSSSWFGGVGYSSSITPTVNIYNSSGVLVTTSGYSSSKTFSVTSSSTYYAVVTGVSYQASQYEIKYTYTKAVNYPVVNNTYISGVPLVGNTMSVAGTYSDLNGSTTSTLGRNWYVGGTLVSTTSTYTIQPNDAGKIISCFLYFMDDAGYWEFFSTPDVLISADAIAPTVTAFSPADGATGVAVDNNIVLTFSEAIAKGTGTIEIHRGSATGPLVESFNVATSTRLSLSGSTLTMDPTSNLSNSTQYFVVLPSGAIKDLAGNSYAGTNNFDFTTAIPRASSFNDYIISTSGNDFINGLSGNDTIFGMGGNDTLIGEAGNDSLNGGEGNDSMLGGAGDDIFDWELDSRAGSDTMVGGAGNDTYVVDVATDVVVEDLNGGMDVIHTLSSYSLANLSNIEKMYAYGTAVVNLTGNTLDNVLAANDVGGSLSGGAGSDTLYGGFGRDTLIGGTGADSLMGGRGSDTIDLTESPASNDLVVFSGGDGTVGSLDRIRSLGMDTITGIKLGGSTWSADKLQFSSADFWIAAGQAVRGSMKVGPGTPVADVDGNFYVVTVGPFANPMDLNGTHSASSPAIVFVGAAEGGKGVSVWYTTNEGAFSTANSVGFAFLVGVNTSNLDATDLLFIA